MTMYGQYRTRTEYEEVNNTKNILVVDDDPVSGQQLKEILSQLRYSVVGIAGDGYDAVELCKELHPDVVLIEIDMPIFDGLSAAETILEENLSDCVVFLTAKYNDRWIERAVQVGSSAYIMKPVSLPAVHAAIEVAYAQSRRLQQVRSEARKIQQKLEEVLLIDRAKALVAQERNISENEAFHELQRLAMNKRCTMLSIAETVVQRNSQRETVNRAKQYLMRIENMSEQNAYRHLTALAKKHDITLFQAAQRILAQMRPLR